MSATKKKPKIAMPPTALSNPAMIEVINKGGSTKAASPIVRVEPTDDKLKSFTFKIYESELAQIRGIQDRLPKRDKMSIHDFVVSAVKEKINKERKTAKK